MRDRNMGSAAAVGAGRPVLRHPNHFTLHTRLLVPPMVEPLGGLLV